MELGTAVETSLHLRQLLLHTANLNNFSLSETSAKSSASDISRYLVGRTTLREPPQRSVRRRQTGRMSAHEVVEGKSIGDTS